MDFIFTPSSIVLQPGETVRFTATNDGPSPHTFTFKAPTPDPSVSLVFLQAGQTISSSPVTFAKAQTIKFFCEFHPFEGTITVGAQPPTSIPTPRAGAAAPTPTPSTADSSYGY